MRLPLTAILLLAITPVFALPNPVGTRTLRDLPSFPIETLRLQTSRPIFRSLEISPLSAWLLARANISGGKTANARIIHSEGNGAYDKMLLEMSNGFSVAGQDLTESRLSNDSMNIYLLVYDIKDGKMAVCFSHTDDARYNGYKQTGTAWMGVLKGNDWVTISRKDDRKWGWNRR